MDRLTQDVRYALRSLRRSRGFTATAVATLALVIGANTAIFSVVSAVVLRPLPFPDPDRLVRIWEANPSMNLPFFSASRLNFEDWKQAASFEGLEAFRRGRVNLTGTAEPETVDSFAVTSGFLALLGVSPALGRSFQAGDDAPETAPVALVSHGLWQRRFGGEASLVGREVFVDGQPHTVVGVLPESLRFSWVAVDVWVPLKPLAEDANRRHHALGVIGRLRPGPALAAATAELETTAARLAGQYPDSNRGWTVRVVRFEDWIVDASVRRAMLVLLAAVGAVLLIACANLAGLQLARASARRRELGVRAALGAGRGRLFAQLLTESLLLSVVGGGLGLAIAYWGVDALRAFIPPSVPRLQEVRVDRVVLAFNALASLLTGLLFGALPALVASRLGGEDLREDARTLAPGHGRRGVRRVLVAAQVALSLVLLVSAGLLVRSFLHLQGARLGFDPEGVVAAQLNPARSRYPDPARRGALYTSILERVRAQPGLQDAALTNIVPFGGGNSGIDVSPEGPSALAPDTWLAVDWRAVSPAYFRVMRIPLLAGRPFADADVRDGPCVILVSQRLAEMAWPGQDAVGRRLRQGSAAKTACTIVGVAGNVRNLELGSEPRAAIYIAMTQFPQATMSLVVRSPLARGALLGALRREVAAVDPELPLSSVRTLAEVLEGPAAQPRFSALMLAGLAGCALLLAAVGLYGLLSFWVTERTRELGVRMAVGARAADLLRLVMGQGLRLALAGGLVGVLAAWGSTRLLSGLLFGVGNADPTTYAVVGLLVGATAALACYLPARRAARLDPLSALRYE